MAKVKEATPLETAIRELSDARTRLDKAQRSEGQLKEELESVWTERLVTGVDGQKRCAELKDSIEDNQTLVTGLTRRIEEKQLEVETLTKEKNRGEANGLVEVAIKGYPEIMEAFAGPVSASEEWVRLAQEAAQRYAACHPGLASMNMKLSGKVATVLQLLRYIEDGKRA